MRIAVLSSGDGWHVRDLARAAATLDHELIPISFKRLIGHVATTKVGLGSVLASGAAPSSAPLAPTAGERGMGEGARDDVRSERIASPPALTALDAVLVRTMPAGSLEQVIFRMDALQQLEGAGVLVLNPPRALEAAIDKYLACCRLKSAGLPVPPTVACENADDAVAAFDELGGDVVVKPLFGSEGKGITRVTDADVAFRVFKTLERVGSVLYLQRFVPHEGFDLRAFVLGDRVLAAMRRRHDSDWRTNVARGATAEPIELSAAETDLALGAARVIGAPIAGVDLLPGRDGRTYVLEVNAVPGWRALSKATGVAVAAAVIRFAAELKRTAKARRREDE